LISFGIIGCGRIAIRHCDILTSDNLGNVKLKAVCDRKWDRASKFGAEYNCSAYVDFNEMIQCEDLDVVVILTESGLHARIALEIAKYRKHVIVEKPMALNLSDANEMIKRYAAMNKYLFVVKQNRFNLPIKKLRSAVETGLFGKLVLGTVRVRWMRKQSYYDQAPWRGTWNWDGGVLANQASHHLDMLLWMMGEPSSVSGVSSTALANIEAEDTAVAHVKFRNGALGVIEATTAARPKDLEGSISILGENGTVEVAGFAMNELKTWMFKNSENEGNENLDRYSINPPDVYGFGHAAFYEHVVDCLLNGSKPLVDGAEGRKSLELICAIYQSIETESVVKFPLLSSEIKLGGGQ